MENRDEMELAADGSQRVLRACDACRSRKIRCDRATPCSNCRSSKLTCTTTAPAQKPQRQRVHISDEYERKIDRIEDRLAGIEHVLESLAVKLGNLEIHKDHSEKSSQSRSNKLTGLSPRSGSEATVHTPAPFEGETTINRQSEFARELLEQAVGNTPSIGQNAEIKSALNSLQEMVTRQGQYTHTVSTPASHPFFHKSFAEIDFSKLERPPWDIVNDVIDKATVYPTVSFAVAFPFLHMRNMKDVSKQVFEYPADSTVARRILVFGVLYNLFTEFACYPVLEKRTESYRIHAQTCKTQMEIAMSQLDMYLPASYENILALLLASAYAVEMCKPSLCWVMVSNAAGLCQNLGYHRISTMKDDTEEERTAKIHAFWFIYLMDKTLSLRLGRASVIQDWDMSLPYPSIDCDHDRFGSLVQKGSNGTDMLLYWIKVSQIQGKAYEKLFSPAGLLQSPEVRVRIATELVQALNHIWKERGEMTKLTFPGAFADMGDIFYHADVVMHYSTCSLIQRAVSPDNVIFNQDCLESARAALVAHQRCSEQFNVKGNEEMWSGYIHWAILQAPFTPFIVIFCNAVLHCDPSDLDTLAGFVLSLESCRTVSEGADKLYKLCGLFLQVAKLYVEAKTKEPSQELQRQAQAQPRGAQDKFFQTADGELNLDMDTMTQFDPYLSALGLMPNSAWPMTQFAPMGDGTDSFSESQNFDPTLSTNALGAQGTQTGNQNVHDWFSGSRYLISLMEDDIQMPDFSI